jgi:hypothetical protein
MKLKFFAFESAVNFICVLAGAVPIAFMMIAYYDFLYELLIVFPVAFLVAVILNYYYRLSKNNLLEYDMNFEFDADHVIIFTYFLPVIAFIHLFLLFPLNLLNQILKLFGFKLPRFFNILRNPSYIE